MRMATGWLRRLVLACVAGGATGAAAEWSVLHVPFSVQPLSSSAAPWLLVAFAVALTARGMREALTLAVAALIAAVLGFYVGEALRGWSVSAHQLAFWAVTSLVVGPLLGMAAGWIRFRGPVVAALGAGVIGGLLCGEAIWGLGQLRFLSPHPYWHVQFAVGVCLAVGISLWRSQQLWLGSVLVVATSVACCAVVGLGTLAAYQPR